MTADWTVEELDRIGAAEELEIALLGAGGAPRSPVPIWVGRAGAGLYVRSRRGTAGGWFRAAEASHANDAVDPAYRDKYGRYSSQRRRRALPLI